MRGKKTKPLGKWFIGIAVLVFAFSGCGKSSDTTAWLEKPYSEIEAAAEGSEVSFYMWGGDERINSWIDGYVAESLKENYNISLTRVPMDAAVFINKLLAEKEAGRSEGVIDLVWINGENFKRAKEKGLLYGAVAEKLPNLEFVPPEEIEYDFGYPVEGYEVPYGKAQFVFEYGSAEFEAPPRSFGDLEQWVRAHPGAFTYPQPPDFTGSAFVRQALYAATGGYEQYLGGYDEALIKANEDKLRAYLKSLQPHLWQQGRDYPQ